MVRCSAREGRQRIFLFIGKEAGSNVLILKANVKLLGIKEL